MSHDRDHPDHANPWTTLETRPVYENPWIAVREDQVLRPDGQPGIYGVVHFKNKAIGVLPVDDDGHVWLVGQYRYPLDAYSWEIPEGGGPEGEDPEETARRELREETGLVAGSARAPRPVAPVELGQRRGRLPLPGHRADPGRERARGDRAAPGPPVRLAEAWAMVRDGRITDSMSVIALLHEAVRRAGSGRPPA